MQLPDRDRRRFAIRLSHFCQRRNPFHRLVHGESVRDLSSGMAGLLCAPMHYFHCCSGSMGHPRQGQFLSPAGAGAEHVLGWARSIEPNPAQRGEWRGHGGTAGPVPEAITQGVADSLLS